MADPSLDPVTDAPAIVGSAGQAWAVDLDRAAARLGVLRMQSGVLAAWVVEAPSAHPIWHSYLVSLVHLRPGPGLPRPTVHLPGATHEILVCALASGAPRQAALDASVFSFLEPPNYAGQFIEEDDAAVRRVEAAVRDICAGRLSPDTDFRPSWISRFGDAMLRSSAGA